jgi:superfamily II DNA or RNA helicase
MITVEKVNAQHYKVIAERGQTQERNAILKRLVFKHRKRQKGYMFTPKYRSGEWDGFINIYSCSNIRAGFIEETINELNESGCEWQWKEEPKNIPCSNPEVLRYDYEEFKNYCVKVIDTVKESFKEKNGVDLEIRDYQINASYKALCQSLGVVLHATGSGKSLTIAFILGYLLFKNEIDRATIIVPRQQLITQFRSDLIDFGFSENAIGMLFGKKKDLSKTITIATYQTLSGLIDTPSGEDFFRSQGMCICDECHTATTKSVTNSILEFHNADFFFGFTGTLPEDEVGKETLYSMFGYVIDERKLKELNEDYDAVTPVVVGMLEFNYGLKSLMSNARRGSSTSAYHHENEFLQDDWEFRNSEIVDIIIKNKKLGKNIIILIKTISYGERIFKELEKRDKDNVFCIFGSGSQKKDLEERDIIVNDCKEKEDPYIIVSNFAIFSTGINIRNIDMIVFCDGGKSKISIGQSVGRGVRKFTDKDEVLILDCYADLKYSSQHGMKREELYKQEGFKVMKKIIYKDDMKGMSNKLKIK